MWIFIHVLSPVFSDGERRADTAFYNVFLSNVERDEDAVALRVQVRTVEY